ncbi:DinB family protein [Chitinophaga pendula]|uniref:DinB family protein n=1 Tax=Chitinophaga TaxID=79328 RepID=UPI000BAEA8D6|nr:MULTISPECIES: DinB family protein [Chitinophaga]ASZ15058.1 damage-inducible protein DinB [Chitinophaga sp. MD30]UCJ08914.1 DinB family protein [Chitinophaga pendula]
MENNTLVSTSAVAFITPEELKEHWQGHRRLTRRLIEGYPEEQLFTHSIAGMRSFGHLLHELIGITRGVRGIAGEGWEQVELDKKAVPDTKEGLLQVWDEQTALIEAVWPGIKAERFHETDKAFGAYEDKIYSLVLYFIDNEVHHRGQAYVYYRSLGLEPHPFWDRN